MRLTILNVLFIRQIVCHVYDDTEQFTNYMGRLMNDKAWQIIIEDIDFLKIRCLNSQVEEFDLYDYLFHHAETFLYLKDEMWGQGKSILVMV